jgi:hypothetical protein
MFWESPQSHNPACELLHLDGGLFKVAEGKGIATRRSAINPAQPAAGAFGSS